MSEAARIGTPGGRGIELPVAASLERGAVFILLLCAAWILPGLIGHDPWKPDEAYSFGLVYEILNGGSWIVPRLAGEPFMEKPPLFYLTAALFGRLLSPPLALHDAARMATGMYLALAFAFTGLAGRELWGRGAGYLATVLLMGSIGLLVRGHQLITDIALLAGTAAGFYGLALLRRRPALGGFWLGTGVGVAFMAKGLLVPGIFGLVVVALPVVFRAWRTPAYAFALSVAAVSGIAWFIVWPAALWLESPHLFMEWLWDNNLARFLGYNAIGPEAHRAHYLGILPWYGLPAWPLAAWFLWRARRTIASRPEIQLPLLGSVIILVVLSASATARELYLLPALVPLCLLAAPMLLALPERANRGWFRVNVTLFSLLAIAIWIAWSAVELGAPHWLHARLASLQPEYTGTFKAFPLLLALGYTAAWPLVLIGLRRSPLRGVLSWTVGLTLVWGLAGTLLVSWVDSMKSYRKVVAEIQAAIPPGRNCIASQNLGEPQRAMLHYLAGIKTQRREAPEASSECAFLLLENPDPADVPPPDEWTLIWSGQRSADGKERFELYERW